MRLHTDPEVPCRLHEAIAAQGRWAALEAAGETGTTPQQASDHLKALLRQWREEGSTVETCFHLGKQVMPTLSKRMVVSILGPDAKRRVKLTPQQWDELYRLKFENKMVSYATLATYCVNQWDVVLERTTISNKLNDMWRERHR